MVTLTRSQFILLLALGFVLCAVVIGAAWWLWQNASESPAEQALFGDAGAVYTDLSGAPVDIADSLGEITVMTLWASWSPLSGPELEMQNRLAEEYRDRGVSFVALNRSEPKDQAERFLATLPPLPYITIVIDQADTFYKGVGGYTMPETIVFDDRGETILHIRAVSTEAELRSILDANLGQ